MDPSRQSYRNLEPEASKAQVIWLAGLMEGEGSFFISEFEAWGKSRVQAVFSINMTDRDVMERVAQIVGVPVFSLPKRPARKRAYRVAFRGAYAVKWMRLLYPFMGKRRKAQIRKATHAYETRPNNGHTRVVQCRSLAARRKRDPKGQFIAGGDI